MDLRQIRYFLCLYEERNVTRAARRLNIVQPAVSMQIRNLEQEFDVKLFERTSRGVTPTYAGKHLYELCAPVQQELSRIQQQMASLAGEVSGEITVGVIPSLTHSVIAEVLATLSASYPAVRVRLVEGYSGTLYEALMADSLDFAVLNSLGECPGVVQRRVVMEPLVLVVRGQDGTELPRTVEPKDLVSRKLVLPSRRHGLRVPIDQWFSMHGLSLTPMMELDALTPTLRLVESSDWATILPGTAVVREVRDGRLRAVPFAGGPLARELVLAHRIHAPLSLASERFVEILVRQIEAVGDSSLLRVGEPATPQG